MIPVPPYPALTFSNSGDTDRPLTHMEEGMQIHVDCSAPRGFRDVILTLYNGTNAVSCYIPDSTEGEVVFTYNEDE